MVAALGQRWGAGVEFQPRSVGSDSPAARGPCLRAARGGQGGRGGFHPEKIKEQETINAVRPRRADAEIGAALPGVARQGRPGHGLGQGNAAHECQEGPQAMLACEPHPRREPPDPPGWGGEVAAPKGAALAGWLARRGHPSVHPDQPDASRR